MDRSPEVEQLAVASPVGWVFGDTGWFADQVTIGFRPPPSRCG